MVCLLILILALPLFLTSCVEDTGAADIEVAQNTKITALEAWKNTIESVTGGLQNFLTNLKVQVDKKANQDDLTALKSRVDSLNTSSGFNSANYYLKTEIDPKITDLQTQINALKTTTPGGGTTAPPVTGVISYTIQSPQQYYQFSSTSSFPIQVKIFNNTGLSKYVRPQFTCTTFGSVVAGQVNFGNISTCQVISNSLGQTPVTFLVSPNALNQTSNSMIFLANGSGVSAMGEYLLGSGQVMDITVQIVIYSQNAALWTLSAGGSDRNL